MASFDTEISSKLNNEQNRRYFWLKKLMDSETLMQISEEDLDKVFRKVDKISLYILNGQPAELTS